MTVVECIRQALGEMDGNTTTEDQAKFILSHLHNAGFALVVRERQDHNISPPSAQLGQTS